MKEKFGRWNILFIQYLKRDWKKIIIWILGLALFSAAFLLPMEELMKDGGLLGMYETLRNPAMTFMVGPSPIKRGHDYDLGAMYSHMMLLFSGLFAMTISILHVIGHTRKEEDLGLRELVHSFQIGRQANSLALIIEVALINLIIGISIAGLMLAPGADTIAREGAILFGISIGLAGIVGGAIALVMAQVMPVSSAATGTSLGIMGLFYIIRGGTDIANVKLSILNPLGWTYLTYPFTENNWLPILFSLIFAIIMIIIAFVLEGARDMGAGYLLEGEGKAAADKSLLSIAGLFIRLNRGIIIGWLISFFILGGAYGAIYGDLESFVKSNELIQQMFSFSGSTMEESFTATIMVVMISLVTILPITIINRLFYQERNFYLSLLYGSKVKPSQLYWTNIILAVGVAILGILLAAGGLGLVAISVMEEATMDMLDFLIIGYRLLPSVLFFTGLAALALGFFPRLGKVIYIYLAYTSLLDYFDGILDLPELFLSIAPQNWLSNTGLEEFKLENFIIVSLISVIFTIIGYFGYRKRDMLEGQ